MPCRRSYREQYLQIKKFHLCSLTLFSLCSLGTFLGATGSGTVSFFSSLTGRGRWASWQTLVKPKSLIGASQMAYPGRFCSWVCDLNFILRGGRTSCAWLLSLVWGAWGNQHAVMCVLDSAKSLSSYLLFLTSWLFDWLNTLLSSCSRYCTKFQ